MRLGPMLQGHARVQLALALIARRTRLSIVHQETDIPRDALRALYREVHGVPAPSGQLPAAGATLITTRALQLQASLFATAYRRFQPVPCPGAQDAAQAVQARPIQAVIRAHDALHALLGAEHSLDMTRCWTLARDLRNGNAELRRCPACEIDYLILHHGRFDQDCPLCALYRCAGLSVRALERHRRPANPSRDSD
ncbi:FlhC family transcriptional regulator [Thiohalocapsa marina]|uniref:FlhC family transcriptional regulator n=1 Tax=Thiohalocapsa marina TaxID=424902 RepID=UPI0036DAF957